MGLLDVGRKDSTQFRVFNNRLVKIHVVNAKLNLVVSRPQVFVEQCRELDIAITVSPRGASSLAQLTAASHRPSSSASTNAGHHHNIFNAASGGSFSGASFSGGSFSGGSSGLGLGLMGAGGSGSFMLGRGAGGADRPVPHGQQQQQAGSGGGGGTMPSPRSGSSLAFLGAMGKELHKGLSHFVQVRGWQFVWNCILLVTV